MAAYGDLPIYAAASDDTYKRLFADIVYNQKPVTSATPYGGSDVAKTVSVPTQLTIVGHGQYVGNMIYLSGDVKWVGYYRILRVINVDTIVLDIYVDTPSAAVWTDGTIKVSSYLTFRSPLDRDLKTYWNFKEALYSFVTSSYPATPATALVPAASTVFNYGINIHSERKYNVAVAEWIWSPDQFVTFSVATALTPVYQVGDAVELISNLSTQTTTSQSAPNGNLRLRMEGNRKLFRPGTQVTISGSSIASNNRVATVISRQVLLFNIEFIEVDIPTPTNYSANETLILTGKARTEFDVNGVITEKTIVGGFTHFKLNVKYLNSVSANGNYSSQANFPTAVTGLSQDAFGKTRKVWQEWFDTGKTIYQGNINGINWVDDNFADKCILGPGSAINKLSTTLPQVNADTYLAPGVNHTKLNIGSQAYILAHNTGAATHTRYRCYNAAGALINDFRLNAATLDYYIPAGIQNLVDSPDIVEAVGDLTATIDQVASWSVGVYFQILNSQFRISEILWFSRAECTHYEPITLLYRDDFGSLIGLPANESHRASIESEKAAYNTKTGKFNAAEDWTHGSGRELTTYLNRGRKKMVVTTDWLQEHDNYKAIGFLNSSEQWIDFKGKLIPVNVLNEEIEDKQLVVDMIYNYQFELEFAADITKK